jgi:putative acetyltransferase
MPAILSIRPSTPADNPRLAHIIRTVMTSYGAVGPGFSIEDAEVDHMHEAYNHARAILYVIEDEEGTVLGCGGISPLQDGEPDTCELKKMYFLPEARGHGIGRRLVTTLEADARERGFRYMYLETLHTMVEAGRLYQKMAFDPLPGPMGNTGHSGCGLFYGKVL